MHRRVAIRGKEIRPHGERVPKRLLNCGAGRKIIFANGGRTLPLSAAVRHSAYCADLRISRMMRPLREKSLQLDSSSFAVICRR
jgi:hypothetical protein